MRGPPRATWVPGADGSGFGIENLPYGVVRRDARTAVAAVRVGDFALDLAELSACGLLEVPGLAPDTFAAPTLNRFLEHDARVWSATRARLADLLDAATDELRPGIPERVLVPLAEVETLLPIAVGDYVDFYSSIEHATNVGRILRPGRPPLAPNWRRLPVGYHGRAGSVVVSGTPIRRPLGQWAPRRPGDDPTFGPEPQLDFELELAFVIGRPPGSPIAVAAAVDHIFGFVLLNDWSARAIQRWEYEPLGPFAGKSFATSIAAWIVPWEALAMARVDGVPQDPPPLAYLRAPEPRALDIDLAVALEIAGAEHRISRVNARGLYWSPSQQLAHATVNGAGVRAGDLFASGAISGAGRDSCGSLLELTRGGRETLVVGDGVERTFLEDGDTVILSGSAHGGISLGEVRGTIQPAARGPLA